MEGVKIPKKATTPPEYVQGTFFADFTREQEEKKRRENAIPQDVMKLYSKNKKIGQPVIKEKKGENTIESKEEITILWGPVHYPLPGQYRRDTDTAETVKVYFGSDYNWHVGGKIVSDIYALEIIEENEDRDRYDEIVKIIEELKELKK
ncbi:MAG TPA: hypothetical protein DCS08_04220 [Candidatus Moranbacteria bacterium]|nr:hypothetical protein [Candidatus Moranbacteria bacterium]HBY10634.1 hypothetical protein [Candidatus Moranbacteria bacterium]